VSERVTRTLAAVPLCITPSSADLARARAARTPTPEDRMSRTDDTETMAAAIVQLANLRADGDLTEHPVTELLAATEKIARRIAKQPEQRAMPNVRWPRTNT
jgi:PBP1b-binding outer membrane lipoprotein LpoB